MKKLEAGNLQLLQKILTATVRNFVKITGSCVCDDVGRPADTFHCFFVPVLEYLSIDRADSLGCLSESESSVLAFITDADNIPEIVVNCCKTLSNLDSEFFEPRFSYSNTTVKVDFSRTKVWIETNGVSYHFYVSYSPEPFYRLNMLNLSQVDFVVLDALKTRSGDQLLSAIRRYSF